MRLTGKFHTEGMNIPLVIQIKRPGSVRGDAIFQGMALVRAYDGETAWQINPLDGTREAEPMTGNDTKEMIDIGDLDGPLVDYKAKGNTVELAGKEELEAYTREEAVRALGRSRAKRTRAEYPPRQRLSERTNPPTGRLGCFHVSLRAEGSGAPVIPQPEGWGSFSTTYATPGRATA